MYTLWDTIENLGYLFFLIEKYGVAVYNSVLVKVILYHYI